ncbi:uncharacterized protein LOC142975550 [Anticarsia gemmatalis]|uniref:uncharacterized protein LOC142975550 n=1 Tax=Anticarsia gemmatalis TaxID=129554 RepID=UPI003F76EA70
MMLCLSLFVFLLTHGSRTAHVTDSPNIFDRLIQKIEKINPPSRELGHSPTDKLYEKLDYLNSLEPDKDFTDEVQLLSAMHSWLSAEQMHGVVKEVQRMKAERLENDIEYNDGDWNDEDSESDYPMDDWDSDDQSESGILSDSTAKPSILAMTPSALNRVEPVSTAVLAAASIAATNARPRIIVDPNMTAQERHQLHSAVLMSTGALVRAGKCLVPQARWLTVRQLAPAADTVYTPPCIQLHRCAHDTGCCLNEGEVCAPVEGKAVALPFYLHKADGSANLVKMQFYNHTQCACIPREILQSAITSRMAVGMSIGNPSVSESQQDERPSRREMERQNDWRAPTEEPALEKDETTAPPQLRRCTCPGLFLASMTDTVPCSCVCDWHDSGRRRDCQSLARGKEHFGLRDRVCVATGDCNPPTCEYGVYDKAVGMCPLRRYRRVRYHARGRY